jgi:hypothetical protein
MPSTMAQPTRMSISRASANGQPPELREGQADLRIWAGVGVMADADRGTDLGEERQAHADRASWLDPILAGAQRQQHRRRIHHGQ